MTQFAPLLRKFKFNEEEAPKPKAKKGVGCDCCPLNDVTGVNKIFGEVTGKDIFIWGQSPGPQENREQREFIGPSGEFLWAELRRVGIKRSMCDVQNAVRCFPAVYSPSSYPALSMRNPSKQEIACCSVYTKRAISESKAKLHLVFGEIAQKQVLGTEYSKGRRIFWSDRLNGHVVCLYHPSYFLRQGYKAGTTLKPNTALLQFRADLDYAVSLLDSKGRYGYVEEQEYIGVTTKEKAKEAYRSLKEIAQLGRRIAVDVEDGVLKEGRQALLCVGFCGKPGQSWVFCLDHEVGLDISDEDRAFCWKVVRKLLSDPEVKKVFHHGSYDARAIAKRMQIKLKSYDYDTEFGEYFFDANAKAYGLQSIVDRRMPEFAGYKEIVVPESFTQAFLDKIPKASKVPLAKRYTAARKQNALNLAQLPWNKMVLYNGADCDVTKRIEITTKKSVNLPLMHVYMDAGLLMAEMEKRGPWFDYRQHERLLKLYPRRVKTWESGIKKIAGDPEFNPRSTPKLKKLLFETLRLTMPNRDEPNTRAETLQLMVDQHEIVQLVLDFRRDSKLLSTYLQGFVLSADRHEGRLATKWWLTGTGTGRLSSGAGKDAEAKAQGLVNLQNVVSDHQLQNMLVSDPNWLEVYKDWKLNGDFTEERAKQFDNMDVFLGFDQGQFEIRVVAQRSGDKNLIDVFKRGEDIHASVGSELMKLPIEKLKEEGPERVAVKGMHFGIIYGLMAAGLFEHLKTEYKRRDIELPSYMNVEWVQNLLDNYFKKYYKVKQMIEGDHKQAERFGFVETMFGFKRKLNVEEQKQLGDLWKGAYWKNQAANTPIQGTAHQLLLIGLVNIIRDKEKYKLLRRAVMEVHDAMYFFVKLRDLWPAVSLGIEMLEEDCLATVRREFGIDWKVPLKVEPKAGFRFGVQVYKLGGKGPKTTAEFLNEWCKANKKVELELKEEFQKLSK